ncbi:MAG TPA: hypothetical protein VMU83_24820 [Hanamia sp.]|nr:hypothetical protein [Hanamia sp.]
MKQFISLLLISSIFLFACTTDSTSKEKAEKQSYQLTKDELLKKEQKNPQDFLMVSGYNKKNILGQTVVKGTILNKASIATFKDVEINLSFYSKTQALLETDKETEYITIGPGQAKDFKTKYFAPKGADSVALQVIGAKVVAE